jgi:hypothetical protein
MNPWDGGWHPQRLGQSYWLVQHSHDRDADLPDDDPRVHMLLAALFSGRGVIENLLDRARDPEHLVWLIDGLPDEFLRLLAFERLWDEQHRRLDLDYWDPLD